VSRPEIRGILLEVNWALFKAVRTELAVEAPIPESYGSSEQRGKTTNTGDCELATAKYLIESVKIDGKRQRRNENDCQIDMTFLIL
jgi:hypothetical protein